MSRLWSRKPSAMPESSLTASGHHQQVDIVPEQQHVQRRVGQHHAHKAVFAHMPEPRRSLFQQHDGPPKAGQNSLLLRRNLTDLSCTVGAAGHEGKGLFVPVFALPELEHQRRIVATAGQMDPAQALDCHDFSGLQLPAGDLDGVPGDAPAPFVQIEDPRPADGTAVRLGVVAPVFDVVVFPVAVRAHGKDAHGGLRPVIGHILDDGKAWAAIGAVDKGITVTPVFRIQQLPQAVVTDADVRA